MKVFMTGAVVYPLLEIIYRGRTHYSMSLAGGSAALTLDRIRRLRLPLPYKAALGALAITSIEYAAGCIWNRHYTVWDYRKTPLNLQGQICLPYSLLWGVLGTGGMLLLQKIDTNNSRT